MGNTCIPIVDSSQCMAKPMQFCRGEESRWRRSRTGRSLSLLQIHRKNNRTVKKVYKTTDCQQRTSGAQESSPLSLKGGKKKFVFLFSFFFSSFLFCFVFWCCFSSFFSFFFSFLFSFFFSFFLFLLCFVFWCFSFFSLLFSFFSFACFSLLFPFKVL